MSANPDWDGRMRTQAREGKATHYVAFPNNDDSKWWARMEYLFRVLPFEVTHQWGGDYVEMVKGIDAAMSWEEKP